MRTIILSLLCGSGSGGVIVLRVLVVVVVLYSVDGVGNGGVIVLMV